VQLRSQAETHPQMLRRVIVMLLNIAGLAERSASYPAAARALVLFILHRAEAYAWDYFTDIFEQHPESFGFYSGSDPDDALELADSFRKLAAALQQSLIQDQIYKSWWGGADTKRSHRAESAGGLNDVADRFAGLIQRLPLFAGFTSAGFAPRLDSS